MKFGEAISSCFHQYVGFSGRARRSEYWYWLLFNFIVSFVLGLIGSFIDSSLLQYIAEAALFLPSLAVSIRRLHDIGKSGWWMLLDLIPLVGPIILIVWECRDSDPEPNQYGPSPKYGMDNVL